MVVYWFDPTEGLERSVLYYGSKLVSKAVLTVIGSGDTSESGFRSTGHL
jgi:hypothetical protein